MLFTCTRLLSQLIYMTASTYISLYDPFSSMSRAIVHRNVQYKYTTCSVCYVHRVSVVYYLNINACVRMNSIINNIHNIVTANGTFQTSKYFLQIHLSVWYTTYCIYQKTSSIELFRLWTYIYLINKENLRPYLIDWQQLFEVLISSQWD